MAEAAYHGTEHTMARIGAVAMTVQTLTTMPTTSHLPGRSMTPAGCWGSMQPGVSVVQMGAHPRPMERSWAAAEGPSAHCRMRVVATQVPHSQPHKQPDP